jgi:hypothetical protein
VVSGIITVGGIKNVSAIYRKLNSNRDRSCDSRFLGEMKPARLQWGTISINRYEGKINDLENAVILFTGAKLTFRINLLSL